jgi:hypothetical protein
MAAKTNISETQAPRWHGDKKFSHLVQSMNDHLSAVEGSDQPDLEVPAVTASVDDAIQNGRMDEATSIVTTAIIERTAVLLSISQHGIDSSRSIANYGVDSLIAVELRNWFVLLFQETIPLLTLLDESLSIAQLGWMVVEKRLALLSR